MPSSTSAGTFSSTAVFSALLLLAGCGGGATEPAMQAHADEEQAHVHGADEHPAAPVAETMPPTETTHPAESPPAGMPPAETATLPDQQAAAVGTAAVESIALAAAFTPLVQGTINNTPYWPVWWGTAKPVDGVNCLVSSKNHNHVLLSIYKDGKRLGFPDGIGRVHAGCYHAYEMHVHDVSGVVHMESDVPKKFKLGQWFSLWAQPLGRTGVAGLAGPVRFYVIDNYKITRFDGNPYDIEMVPHREILIVTGTAMTVAPKYQWPLGI